MKTSVYIATAIITLSSLSTAAFLMLRPSGKSLPTTVQASQSIEINWGEGVDVKLTSETTESTQVAQN